MSKFKNLFKHGLLNYHILGWVLFFILHYIFFYSYEVKVNLEYQLVFWIFNMFAFYLNYYLIVPYLLFRNKVFIYVATTLVSVAALYFMQAGIADKRFEKIRHSDFEERMKRIDLNNFSRDTMEFRKPPFPHRLSGSFDPTIRPGPAKRRGNAMELYTVLLLFTTGTAFRVMGKLEKEEKLKKDAESRKTIEELKILKQQINPHFLFNSLNSIYSLANKKSEKTIEAILKLSATLRYRLYDVNQTVVYLKNEIEHIHNFIELQKFRLTEDTEVKLITVGEFEGFLIEPLLLIPFVENAFKFGVDNRQKSFIHININIINNELLFCIKNQIINLNANSGVEKSGGIGLSNVKRRLEILYPKQHKLEIGSNNNIFIVNLQVTLKK